MGKIIFWALNIYEFLIILAVFKSFMIYFSRGNRLSYFITKLNFVDTLTDPYLNIFRKFIPPAYGLDFSAMIGLVILQMIKRIVLNNLIIN